MCKRICEDLVKRGHSVNVVSMGLAGLPDAQDIDGVKIYRLAVGRKLPNMSYPLEHLRFLWKGRKFLREHMKSESYDVIHCHFIISTGILARWVSKKYRIPFIMTAHGSDLPNYNPDRFSLIHQITPIWIRSLLKACASITTTSEFLAGLIRPYMPENKRDVVVIPNGIDIPKQTQDKENIILSTGRMLRRKGFHNLIEAVSELNIDYEVHICGDGPEMNLLKSLAPKSKTKIVLHGWLDSSSEKYKNLLAKAKIFSLVSEFENASVSILEAMSSSCATITSNHSGTAEMVADSGILLPAYDSQALAHTLHELVKDEERIQELASKARRRASEKYSWERIVDSYEGELQKASTKS